MPEPGGRRLKPQEEGGGWLTQATPQPHLAALLGCLSPQGTSCSSWCQSGASSTPGAVTKEDSLLCRAAPCRLTPQPPPDSGSRAWPLPSTGYCISVSVL